MLGALWPSSFKLQCWLSGWFVHRCRNCATVPVHMYRGLRRRCVIPSTHERERASSRSEMPIVVCQSCLYRSYYFCIRRALLRSQPCGFQLPASNFHTPDSSALVPMSIPVYIHPLQRGQVGSGGKAGRTEPSPLDEADELLLELALPARLLEIVDAAEVEHDVARLAEVDLGGWETISICARRGGGTKEKG